MAADLAPVKQIGHFFVLRVLYTVNQELFALVFMLFFLNLKLFASTNMKQTQQGTFVYF